MSIFTPPEIYYCTALNSPYIMLHRFITITAFILSVVFVSCDSNKTGNPIADAYNNEDYETVIKESEAALERGEELGTQIIIGYAEALCHNGQMEKALEVLKKEEKKSPHDYMLLQRIGATHQLMGHNDKAIRYYKKVIALNKHYARPYINLAEIYKEQHKNKQAVDAYLSAVKLFYENEAYQEAEEFSLAIGELDPVNDDAIAYLAATYYKTGRSDDYEEVKSTIEQYGKKAALKKLEQLIK